MLTCSYSDILTSSPAFAFCPQFPHLLWLTSITATSFLWLNKIFPNRLRPSKYTHLSSLISPDIWISIPSSSLDHTQTAFLQHLRSCDPFILWRIFLFYTAQVSGLCHAICRSDELLWGQKCLYAGGCSQVYGSSGRGGEGAGELFDLAKEEEKKNLSQKTKNQTPPWSTFVSTWKARNTVLHIRSHGRPENGFNILNLQKKEKERKANWMTEEREPCPPSGQSQFMSISRN